MEIGTHSGTVDKPNCAGAASYRTHPATVTQTRKGLTAVYEQSIRTAGQIAPSKMPTAFRI
ncbi:unnamed protein product [Gemmata massiliana]|uniref:Uncharacterized protein n=1 Tax=Gemmata massiliana TaxID=1210884 RepID=A0A6P2CUG9_9BACT|nr:unnamed protein product [Gemmata massiliana]